MDKPVIIVGEASETDSEDELAGSSVNAMTISVQGAVIPGEDSESDTEIEASVGSATSALHQTESLDSNDIKYNSLFHQKLREHNDQLRNSLGNVCQSSVNDASKHLNVIDHQVLRSQVTMQNAVASLKTLSISSLSIKSKFHSLLSSNFLSNVTVQK